MYQFLFHHPFNSKEIPRQTKMHGKRWDEGGTPRLCEALAELLELAQNRSVRLSLESPRTRGVRLVRLLFEKGSSKVYDYSTFHNLVGKFPRALARGDEKGVGEIRICLASKCEFGGRAENKK